MNPEIWVYVKPIADIIGENTMVITITTMAHCLVNTVLGVV